MNQGNLSFAERVAGWERVFRCPICFGPMRVVDGKSLVCSGNHCFDLSRKGYVNFLSRPVASQYGKQLFASRAILFQHGFFAPLCERLFHRMMEAATGDGPILILDAGCGEGSHLSWLRERFRRAGREPVAIGVDLSKEGILAAARNDRQAIWCVADLARCPLAESQFQFVTNILSPANYAEFGRMLADGGWVIKVVPGRGYLAEIRELLPRQSRRADPADAPVERFGQHLRLIEMEPVQYRFRLNPSLYEHLLRMTPLTWGADGEFLRAAENRMPEEVTVDLTVLYGRMPG